MKTTRRTILAATAAAAATHTGTFSLSAANTVTSDPDAELYRRAALVLVAANRMEQALDHVNEVYDRLYESGIRRGRDIEAHPDMQPAIARERRECDRVGKALDALGNCPANTLDGLLTKISLTYEHGGESCEGVFDSVQVDLEHLTARRAGISTKGPPTS